MPTAAQILRAMKAAKRLGMTVRILPDGSLLLVPMPEPEKAPEPARVDWHKEIRL